MLRYFYLLSLLICIIDISFCYEYTRKNVLNNRPRNRKSDGEDIRILRRNVEQRKFKKRSNFDIDYDKEPVAQIDVANFIKSPEEGFLEKSDLYEFNVDKMYANNYDYGSLIEKDTDEKIDEDENNSDLYTDNLLGSQRSSSLDMGSAEKLHDNKLQRVENNYRKKLYDTRNDNNQYNRHYQKKCALKNIKIPFFSHNKSATTKSKKEKKRKLYSFNSSSKDKVTSKANDEVIAKQNNVREKQNSYKYYNITKRSYIERLCPACRKKFIVDAKKTRHIYNTRRRNFNDNFIENKSKNLNIYKYSANSNAVPVDKVNLSEVNKRRKREDDNRSLERQKELEDLEKRIESVSVNNPPYYNKLDFKA